MAPAVIDRNPQNLPIPLGGVAPVWVWRRARRRLLRRSAPSVARALAAVMALAGLTLLLLPNRSDAYMDSRGIHVGAMTLTAAGFDPHTGLMRFSGAASYALVEPGGGSARASASWTSAGVTASGWCSLRTEPARLVDECTFDLPAGRTTSVDVLNLAAGSLWQRTYSDGEQVEIGVAANGAVIPVPFAIGR